jgi:hypothetical protein
MALEFERGVNIRNGFTQFEQEVVGGQVLTKKNCIQKFL